MKLISGLLSLFHVLSSTYGSSLLCVIYLFFIFKFFFLFLDTTMGTKEPKSRTVEEIKGCPSSIQVAEVEVEIP